MMDLCAVGNSLVTLMCHLFNVYGLIHHFQLDMVKLHRFLGKLQGCVSDYTHPPFVPLCSPAREDVKVLPNILGFSNLRDSVYIFRRALFSAEFVNLIQ